MTHLLCSFLFLCISNFTFSPTKYAELKGVIKDKENNPIPYVAISILSKNIGTSSNYDGAFSLKLTKENFQDIITISTIGFKTVKLSAQDLIDRKEKEIVLEEDVVSLDEITLINPESVVRSALKNLRNTTYKSGHQLNILYRRFSSENNISSLNTI